MTNARSLRRRPGRRQAGFTLLEVMMALTVLAIGMLGMVALQTSTISATQDANMFAVANSITRTWVQRLQRDAQRWNHPSKFRTDYDWSETAWLNAVTTTGPTVWFRPAASSIEPNASAAFDMYGRDVTGAALPNAVYCTHLRLRQLYPDMLQAEVRVFWQKRKIGNPAKFASYGFTAGICDPAAAPAALGLDDVNFHWSYAVTGLTESRAQ